MNEVNGFNEVEWHGESYFDCPPPPVDTSLPPDPMTDPWLWWQVAFHRAEGGDFSLLPRLMEIVLQADDPFLEAKCTILFGDAGTSVCFEAIIRELTATSSAELTIDLCEALATRGRLADVPIILDAYGRVADIEDAAVIPSQLSDVLESEVGVVADPSQLPSLDEYHIHVMNRYQALVEKFGDDQLLVLRGEKFGVVSLAKQILDRACRPFFRNDLSRRFLASTGINGAQFYKNGVFQPLTTVAIVEEFLESTEAERYEDGVRYFYGHRIPVSDYAP